MSFLSDKTKGIFKIGETIKEKTHEYSSLAKLTLDVKKDENELEKNLISIGKYIIEKIGNGENSLDLKDKIISTYAEKIKEVKKSIEKKKSEIDKLKQKAFGDNEEGDQNTEREKQD